MARIRVKPESITQAEVSAREIAEVEEREQSVAEQSLRKRFIINTRLTLWLIRYVWPRLTNEEKGEVREIIPDSVEQDIQAELSKLR